MSAKGHESIPNDLSARGRQLLKLIADHVRSGRFVAGNQSTYLGYKECCISLGLAPADADLRWGRFLQPRGLNELNEWTQRHNFPRVTGLIVNQSGDRQYWPGGDFFSSNGRPDMDGVWWDDQAKKAAQFDWQPFL